MTDTITQLLKCWNEETKQELSLKASERVWYIYIQNDYTVEDLRTMLRWIKFKNRATDKPRSLNLRLVLGVYDEHPMERFGIDLSEAKGWARNVRPKPTPKEQALSQLRPNLGGENTTSTHTIPAKEALKQAIKEL